MKMTYLILFLMSMSQVSLAGSSISLMFCLKDQNIWETASCLKGRGSSKREILGVNQCRTTFNGDKEMQEKCYHMLAAGRDMDNKIERCLIERGRSTSVIASALPDKVRASVAACALGSPSQTPYQFPEMECASGTTELTNVLRSHIGDFRDLVRQADGVLEQYTRVCTDSDGCKSNIENAYSSSSELAMKITDGGLGSLGVAIATLACLPGGVVAAGGCAVGAAGAVKLASDATRAERLAEGVRIKVAAKAAKRVPVEGVSIKYKSYRENLDLDEIDNLLTLAKNEEAADIERMKIEVHKESESSKQRMYALKSAELKATLGSLTKVYNESCKQRRKIDKVTAKSGGISGVVSGPRGTVK